MTIPISIYTWLLVVLPIASLLFLMVKLKWGGYKAAPVALVLTVVVAVTSFKSGASLLLFEITKGAWSSLNVLLVIWPAILIYEITNEAKVLGAFKSGVKKLTPNQLLQILAVGWVFTSFLQGITGFGVPVAVAAPLLASMGVLPVWSVVIPLIGQAWGGTFGTLAVAWDALAAQSNLYHNQQLLIKTIVYSTALIWIWNLASGLAICWFYAKLEGVKKGFFAVAILSLIHGGGQMVVGLYNQTLACFLPSCVALVAIILLGKTKYYSTPWHFATSEIISNEERATQAALKQPPSEMVGVASEPVKSINDAFMPYYTLTAITVMALLIRPINTLLSQFKIWLSFPATQTGYGFVNQEVERFSPISLFTHAGLFLLISAVVGYAYYRKRGWIAKSGATGILKRTSQKAIRSSIAVIMLMMTSRVMSGSGQTVVLAQGVASALGDVYVFISPLIGTLGAFMTSSTMASNILFSGFQLTTATLLNIDAALLLAAQTAGASIGNAIAPGNVILGTTTAQIPSKEGEVLKRILPMAATIGIVMGTLVFVLSRM